MTTATYKVELSLVPLCLAVVLVPTAAWYAASLSPGQEYAKLFRAIPLIWHNR